MHFTYAKKNIILINCFQRIGPGEIVVLVAVSAFATTKPFITHEMLAAGLTAHNVDEMCAWH